MKIKLVLEDWQKNGVSIYRTCKGRKLTAGDFHSGSAFDSTIDLTIEQEEELNAAMAKGYNPVFWTTK